MNAILKDNHAEQNAAAWAASIAEMVAALECDYDRLQELRDEREALTDTLKENEREQFNVDAAKFDLQQWDEQYGDEFSELTQAATVEGELQDNPDDVRERIQESALSVQVRSGWTDPGADMQAEEFEILLTTGGPALRIRGELGEHQEPDRAWLEYQDWGTPWTQYFKVEQSTLLSFARCFYFGS